MVKAIPVNEKGEQIGKARTFPDRHWNKMQAAFKSKLAWKKVEIKAEQSKVFELIAKSENAAPVKRKRKTKSNKK